jgi:membrane protease subunit HflK
MKRRQRRWWLLGASVGAAMVLSWFGSAFYTVKPDERGVVRRFGQVVAEVGPGIHHHLPWPMGRVDIVKTTSVMKVGVGFPLPEAASETVTGAEFLTGDTNLVGIALVLQYVIQDPADFLTRIDDPRAFVSAIAQGILAQAVASMPVDEVLTTGRVAIQDAVRTKTQRALDRERSGIRVTSASIMTIALDRTVAAAFQEVADAMADREKTQNEARTYASAVIPKARGDAQATIAEANNYQRQRVAEATGETARFLALERQYQKAAEVSRERLYFEMIEKALGKTKIYVLNPGDSGGPVTLRVIAP